MGDIMKKDKKVQSRSKSNMKNNNNNSNIKNTSNSKNASNKGMGFDVEANRSFKLDENNEHSFELRDDE